MLIDVFNSALWEDDGLRVLYSSLHQIHSRSPSFYDCTRIIRYLIFNSDHQQADS